MDNKSIMSKYLNKYKPKKPKALISKFMSKKQQTTTNTGTGFYETLIIKNQPKIKEPISNKDNEVCKKVANVNSLMKKKYMIPSQFPNITQGNETKNKN